MAQTYKRLGAITSSGTIGTADVLYTCNVTAAIASTIVICNTAATSATYRVCVSTANTFPASGYTGYIAYGEPSMRMTPFSLLWEQRLI